MIYRGIDKMSELLANEHSAFHVLCRFGIPMGVGERTIEQVCASHGIHTPTFLAIVNCRCRSEYQGQTDDIDLATLQTYLKNAHTFFLEFQLPRLRRQLIEAINPADNTSQIPMLILRYFDEYVQEIRIHIRHEDEGKLEVHAMDDRHIAHKMSELVNLIIKYYPEHDTYPFANEILANVIIGIYQTEEELRLHCAIEDDILRPVIEKSKERKARQRTESSSEEQEELSEREKEVVIQLVKGLSNKEIADTLCISTHTVISHRKNITKKLKIHSVAGLTIYAIVNHLVEI